MDIDYESSDLKENCNSKNFPPKIVFEKEYVKELLKCKNETELIDSLKKKNVEITTLDAKFILNQVKKYKESISSKDLNYQEIPDIYLQDISGGRGLLHYFLLPIYAGGYVIGATPMVGVALYNMLRGVYDQLRGN